MAREEEAAPEVGPPEWLTKTSPESWGRIVRATCSRPDAPSSGLEALALNGYAGCGDFAGDSSDGRLRRRDG